MDVLVCGARGFIGRHIVSALQAHGHRVVRGVSARASVPAADECRVDFVHDTEPAAWRSRVEEVDAVVNAVGVLRDTRLTPMRQLHTDASAALFEACAEAGIRRVVHISALGVDGGSTPYARTKREADRRLLALNDGGRLDGVVLRPSIVYGPGGASAALFDALSRLPVLPLPGIMMRTKIQPVLVYDLAQAVAQAVSQPQVTGVVACVGSRPLTIAGFIASLRAQRGHAPARQVGIPDGITRLSARLGDWLPITPWDSQTLALLAADNTADAGPFQALLGHEPADPYRFVASP